MNYLLTCAECGRAFVMQADYAILGVQGHVVKSDGTLVTFIDPSEPHLCDDCTKKRVEELLKELEEKNANQKEEDPDR